MKRKHARMISSLSLASLCAMAASMAACSAATDSRELESATTSVVSTWLYSFDAQGLPTGVTSGSTARTIVANGTTVTSGGVQYTLDALGRTIKKGALSMSYGPDSRLDTATNGTSTFTYVYDENGTRLLKKTNGVVTAAWVDDEILVGSDLIEPVTANGKLLGMTKNGVFELVATDTRGTVLASTDGTARLPSPFGDRTTQPDVAAAIDYARQSYDADLGVVRMGVRDYDPTIERFLTPDPAFLVSPEKCVKSPVECNLYGYARNQPLDYVDSTGTETTVIGFSLAKIGAEIQIGSDWNISVKVEANLRAKGWTPDAYVSSTWKDPAKSDIFFKSQVGASVTMNGAKAYGFGFEANASLRKLGVEAKVAGSLGTLTGERAWTAGGPIEGTPNATMKIDTKLGDAFRTNAGGVTPKGDFKASVGVVLNSRDLFHVGDQIGTGVFLIEQSLRGRSEYMYGSADRAPVFDAGAPPPSGGVNPQ